jgi:hypothetical protein
LAERRRRQDRLIGAVTDALAARETARAALETSRACLDDAMAALAELGIGADEVGTLLGVPARELIGETAERRARGVPARVAPAGATGTGAAHVARAGGEDGPVRLWLAMIERGPSPKTHGLDQSRWLLCGGGGDPEHLATWVGYAFDVDCQRCARLLAQQLTEEEFG